MPRPPRADEGGGLYHALNRGNLRAKLVDRAEDWRWGSLWRWQQKPEPDPKLLSPWPLARLPKWVERVNDPLTKKDLDAVRLSAQRGRPLGDDLWVESIAGRLNDEALHDGSRILSAYILPKTDVKILIITEAADDDGERAATTALLPEEY